MGLRARSMQVAWSNQHLQIGGGLTNVNVR